MWLMGCHEKRERKDQRDSVLEKDLALMALKDERRGL